MSTQPREQSRLQASTNVAMTQANKNAKAIQTIKRKQKQSRKGTTKRPGRSPRIRAPMAMASAPQMCTLHYGSALCDPEFTPAGACIPYGFPTPSQRIKTFTRGTFTLGTTGKGWVAWNPAQANDANAVVCTSATSVGTNSTQIGSFTNTTAHSLTKLPYTTAQITAAFGLSGRVVAAVLKCRYAGTEGNRNGIVTTLEEPQHLSMATSTGDGILTYIQSLNERPKPDGSWHVVKWSGPVNSNETQFTNTAQYNNKTTMMICYIQGAVGDTYEFECFEHVEYAGQLPPEQMSGHSDTSGYSQLITAIKDVTNAEPLNDKNSKSALSTFVHSAGSSMKGIIDTYGPMVMDAISARLLGPAGPAINQAIRNAVTPTQTMYPYAVKPGLTPSRSKFLSYTRTY
jgi:hypothetical protein